ncbi:hypothetical protein [Nonomuraea sp. NPDC046570]|uniref:hypothetical protein n=1 Tax=Nonomuraea sp. NPDC046570 TaxID=3155255 RepID=UPI0033E07417
MHDLQEAAVLPGLTSQAFDLGAVLDPGAWYSALLSGMFNIAAQPTDPCAPGPGSPVTTRDRPARL